MNAPVEPIVSPPIQRLARLFAVQREAFARERYPTLAVRRDRLARLLALVTENEDALVRGDRRRFRPSLVARDATGRAHRHRERHRATRCAAPAAWMRARSVPTPMSLLPGRGEIVPPAARRRRHHQPVELPGPARARPGVGALAAGNRVLLKPSELTPAHLRRCCAELVARALRRGRVRGGHRRRRGRRARSRGCRFDHLFFTGSTAVGRHVARAAAENLTPVTLELGGKSPGDLRRQRRLGRSRRRGSSSASCSTPGRRASRPTTRSCPRRRRDALRRGARATRSRACIRRCAANPDYTAIVNERHYRRLDRAGRRCAREGRAVVELNPGRREARSPRRRKLAPTLLVGVDRRHGGDAGGDLRAAAAGRDVRHARRGDRAHQRASAPARALLLRQRRDARASGCCARRSPAA